MVLASFANQPANRITSPIYLPPVDIWFHFLGFDIYLLFGCMFVCMYVCSFMKILQTVTSMDSLLLLFRFFLYWDHLKHVQAKEHCSFCCCGCFVCSLFFYPSYFYRRVPLKIGGFCPFLLYGMTERLSCFSQEWIAKMLVSLYLKFIVWQMRNNNNNYCIFYVRTTTTHVGLEVPKLDVNF